MNHAMQTSSRQLQSVLILGFLCAIPLLLSACEGKPAYTPPPPPKVTVSQPVRRNVTNYLELTGNTQAVNTAQLRARVEGYLDKVLFKDGEMVKKGQLLFLIQQNTYEAKLRQAEANILTQKALLDHAQTEYTRYTGLYNNKAAAQTDVENWHYQRDAAQAALLSAEAQRDLAKLDLGYTWVTAPFNGRIDRRLVDVGNLVGSGTSTVLAEITQLDPIYVYCNVSEMDILPLIGGSGEGSAQQDASKYPVQMGLANEEGYPHDGTLDFTATSVSSGTGTLLLRGVFPNAEGKMLPGQYARVRVSTSKERSALLVPQVALGFDQLGSYVLVVNGQNVVERRNVKTGAVRDGMYVIEEGLTGDEWVVVKGLLRANFGRPVTPERESLAEPRPSSTGPTPNSDQKGAK
jgi:RND family efflux transporter MFP subunit